MSGIGIFRDSSQRNDVRIKGRLSLRGYDGKYVKFLRETDTHKFAHKSANFHYRWGFSVKAPAGACSLGLKVVDIDSYGFDEDLVYAPKELPLDHMLHLAYKNWKLER